MRSARGCSHGSPSEPASHQRISDRSSREASELSLARCSFSNLTRPVLIAVFRACFLSGRLARAQDSVSPGALVRPRIRALDSLMTLRSPRVAVARRGTVEHSRTGDPLRMSRRYVRDGNPCVSTDLRPPNSASDLRVRRSRTLPRAANPSLDDPKLDASRNSRRRRQQP